MLQLSLFLKFNFFITTLLYLGFLYFIQEATLKTVLFDITATISTSATLYLIFYLLFLPLFRLGKGLFFSWAHSFLSQI